PVYALYRDVAALRAWAWLRRWPRRSSRRGRATAGNLSTSAHDLALATAENVVAILQAAGLGPFVVDYSAGALTLGLTVDERADAVTALARELDQPGWYFRWHHYTPSRVSRPEQALRHGAGRGAVELRVAHVHSYGETVVGLDEGVLLTFWEPGTSGQLERIGTRSQERFDASCDVTTETIDGHDFPGRSAFPVGSSLERVDFPVDVVYTWVDGTDSAWLQSFAQTAEAEGREVSDSALDPARYADRDELRYSLRSRWAFAGWVRNIYVVTAGQRPEWLVEDDRLRIVDHAEIFFGEDLPTFNSHSIEASLHRIDGLAEHFLYFNDDMFLGRPIQPSLFFNPAGLAKVFTSMARVPGHEFDGMLAYDTAARRGSELLRERFGRVPSHKPYHSPYAVRRSVMDEIEAEFPEPYARTVASRFRSPDDLSVPASLAQHYALLTGRGVEGELRNDYVNLESARLGLHLERLRLSRSFDTFCINETRHDDARTVDAAEHVARFLDSYFPIASPWERAADEL
ncbi:MAG: stealth family protein, partial [Acidimicrobiia bacterium]|nr:stealth family protein [Acidimicrobiia bacterium]